MSGDNTYYLALSVGFSLSLVMLIVVLFSKKTNSSRFYLGEIKNFDPKMAKLVNMVGGDLMSILPKSVHKKSMADKKMDDLFRESGNPWEVTKIEFTAIRATYAFLFAVIAFLFCIVFRPPMLISAPIVLLAAWYGWNKPVSKYKSLAKSRSVSFKKNLPEMLDYLTMIMSDGTYTLPNAIETVLPHLKESVVKDEFRRVVEAINAGSTTEAALNDLAVRVPSTSLESFVNAVNNANQLNTPMDGLMKSRAETLRKDLLNEIEMVIQTLPTKTMVTVGPPAIFSMLILFMVPVIVSLLTTL